MREKLAVILSGGGARAAYEAGVLRAISEMGRFKTCPFAIITGVSAGAINGTSLAEHIDDFDLATRKLWETWAGIRVENVFRTDSPSFLKTGAQWAMDLSLGQWFGASQVTHLLDTSPLRKFLSERINPDAVNRSLRSGGLHALSLSAVSYSTGRQVSFYDGAEGLADWDEAGNRGERSALTLEHVMASTAIPIFFPPVRVGATEYGDGGLGLRSPLGDALHLGAERVLVIGLNNAPAAKGATRGSFKPASLGDIIGVLLNGLFSYALDSDLARLEQGNLDAQQWNGLGGEKPASRLRDVPALVVQPSRSLGTIDTEQFSRLPYPLKHMLKGLGVSDDKGWDLLSYLAFEPGYTGALLELGYADALAMKDKILSLIADGDRAPSRL